MSWGCIGCGTRSDDMDQAACANCGRKRDLSGRPTGNPITPRVLAMPSRSGGPPHILGVDRDRRVVCASCQAAVHGRTCWRAGDFQRRLLRRKKLDVHELLTVKERVFDTLYRHEKARDSDLELLERYFEDWHRVPPETPWPQFLVWVQRTFKGNVLETVRRRRAEWQAAGWFPPCDEVLADRRVRESTFHQEFGQGATG